VNPPARSLYLQVLIAIAFGVTLGALAPPVAIAMKPLGDIFIGLIKMLIGPIIFCTVVAGIGGVKDMKQVGKTGGLAIVYFELLSTVALILGLIVVNVFKPGAGMNIDVHSLDAAAVQSYVGAGKLQSLNQFLLDLVPASVIGAFAQGNILQILLIALLFGFALQALGIRADAVRRGIESISEVLFAIVGIVMKLAPIGAFGAMAFTIGKYGFASLFSLAKLMGCFYLTCIVFVAAVLGAVARMHGFKIWRFIAYIKDELFIVLGTSSSESVLPRMMAKLEALGADRSVVGLVIPAGYSFNLDGTAIYLTMAAVFVAQATNTPLGIGQQLALLGVLLLTSKGAAGVTGSGFIVLAATLSSVGAVPVAALTLILGIDRFMSEARALTNVIGNGVATLVVARWSGALDRDKLRVQLDAA
jgi:aerobic C4-dicarboxylate transport protein